MYATLLARHPLGWTLAPRLLPSVPCQTAAHLHHPTSQKNRGGKGGIGGQGLRDVRSADEQQRAAVVVVRLVEVCCPHQLVHIEPLVELIDRCSLCLGTEPKSKTSASGANLHGQCRPPNGSPTANAGLATAAPRPHPSASQITSAVCGTSCCEAGRGAK